MNQDEQQQQQKRENLTNWAIIFGGLNSARKLADINQTGLRLLERRINQLQGRLDFLEQRELQRTATELRATYKDKLRPRGVGRRLSQSQQSSKSKVL